MIPYDILIISKLVTNLLRNNFLNEQRKEAIIMAKNDNITMFPKNDNTKLPTPKQVKREVEVIRVNFLSKEIKMVQERILKQASDAISQKQDEFLKEGRIPMVYDHMIESVNTFCHGLSPEQKNYVLQRALWSAQRALHQRGWEIRIYPLPYWYGVKVVELIPWNQ